MEFSIPVWAFTAVVAILFLAEVWVLVCALSDAIYARSLENKSDPLKKLTESITCARCDTVCRQVKRNRNGDRLCPQCENEIRYFAEW